MRISPVMTKRLVAALAALAAVGLWSSVAAAGVLGTTSRAINSDGPDGGFWRGSVHAYQDAFVNKVDATFDWAVFAPGQFQLFLDDEGIAGTDPAPGEVIYAYQVSEVVTANPGISFVTVGLDPSDVVSITPTQVLTSWAGEQPITPPGHLPGTSAKWNFDDVISAGEISPLLVFASPYLPELDTFQVNSGLASFNGNTPTTMVGSPSDRIYPQTIIPEPGSIMLVVIGIAMLSLRRKTR